MPAPDLLTGSDTRIPDTATLLTAAVAAIGGAERPGQVRMAEAVERAIASGEHLAAQAGTGTGKSLAYLVPAIRHAVAERTTVVVSTATIALQRQLVDRDLPRLAETLAPLLGQEPKFAILKGRRNYLCLNRVQTGAPDEPEEGGGLFDPQQLSALGRQVKRLNEWAEETATGDRDELVPGVNETAWRQVSVTAKECLGAQRCPQGTECFAELARARAGEAHIVVTNHALLAIDALEEFLVLPEHDVVIVDEAHELVDRVTSVATDDLSAAAVETAARRCGRLIEEGLADRLKESAEGLGLLLEDLPGGRMDVLSPALGNTLAVVRDAAHACLSALGPEKKDNDPANAAARKAARSSLEDLHETAVRLLEAFQPEISARSDVVWLEKPFVQEGRPKRPPSLHVAPIGVGGLLRTTLFGERTAVLTSATLTLGGSFEPLARQWGLPPLEGAGATTPPDARTAAEGLARTATGEETGGDGGAGGKGAEKKGEAKEIRWSGLDAGSPFDHARSGILYVARHLPQPGRDGLPDAYLTEITELIEAAGGRTLGLFSSMRAARQAADELRDHLTHPLLCQGEDSTSLLVKQFAEEERTSLFGTLSLWQGVDVPGPSLRLVIMDRIPFPRPDDPVSSARSRAVAARGGNGFMAVAATHAALLLAQGAGRLLRSMDDRGVVAILDPRLATARYGGFLKSSLPPFWPTTDADVVRNALRRLDAAAPAPGDGTEAEPGAEAEPGESEG
ncbi:ATP-dependent DNA helicase [Actinomadura viridis]|uniref:ATP-dependent helicase DinG n=1 Tax=Actinomadura viridis TaxID=58110 RepID=A0A931DJX6_9ACTN|nr:ATP-dependent DNA helicase [Actinomadura viridis]MBG6091390.1 ATP-dependent DNA helicase DinG [Actinomadura viridis]